jgi:phospholipase C
LAGTIAVDLFGDGARIARVVVSPSARRGYIDHTDDGHASILKFIERNWSRPSPTRTGRYRRSQIVRNVRGDFAPHVGVNPGRVAV